MLLLVFKASSAVIVLLGDGFIVAKVLSSGADVVKPSPLKAALKSLVDSLDDTERKVTAFFLAKAIRSSRLAIALVAHDCF
jgi:hypothetical protein